MAETSQYYTTKELADILGVCRRTLLKYQRNDDFPKPLRLSSRYFKYNKAEVAAYLSNTIDADCGPNQEACNG